MTNNIVLKVENISKQYRLGQSGTGTIGQDLNRFWHSIRGLEDPYLTYGDLNDKSVSGGSEFVWSLREVSFEVKKGEVLGIIGKNGAGKSTLLKILSQITTPTKGQVGINGRIASLLEVGTGFHPDLTGRENIFLNGAILGMTKYEIKSKFEEIVEFSGVAKYIDTPVKRYSSGMLVRLGFAVAAHLEPEILIVDEVLAVGDVEFQEKCLGKMKNVSGEGRTILFVSHNMAVLKSLCSRVILLKNGQLEFEGSINEGVEKYLSVTGIGKSTGLIEAHHRTINTGKVLINSVNVCNEEFKKANSIYFNKIIDIEMRIQFNESINNLILDARFVTLDGIELLHTMNAYDGDFFNARKGIYDVKLKIENRLQPGRYFINLGIHHSNGITLEYLEKIIELNVLSFTNDEGKGMVYEFKLGYFRPKSEWIIEERKL